MIEAYLTLLAIGYALACAAWAAGGFAKNPLDNSF